MSFPSTNPSLPGLAAALAPPGRDSGQPDPPPETPMLDVHPPHSAVHGWRDFFIHIATITIGLLIALGLEGTVEYLHHRHIVAEARENIRHEIEENKKNVGTNLKYSRENTDRVNADLQQLHFMQKSPNDFHGHLDFNMEWNSFNESAWRSARDMGALTYMPYAEVQGYDDLYHGQELVDQQALPIILREALAVAPMIALEDKSSVAPARIEQMLHDTAEISLSLRVLDQTAHELDRDYIEALKKMMLSEDQK